MRIGPWRQSSTSARTTLSMNLPGLRPSSPIDFDVQSTKATASAVGIRSGFNYVIISELSEADMERFEDLLREQTD